MKNKKINLINNIYNNNLFNKIIFKNQIPGSEAAGRKLISIGFNGAVR